jgi:hypothetical protein
VANQASGVLFGPVAIATDGAAHDILPSASTNLFRLLPPKVVGTSVSSSPSPSAPSSSPPLLPLRPVTGTCPRPPPSPPSSPSLPSPALLLSPPPRPIAFLACALLPRKLPQSAPHPRPRCVLLGPSPHKTGTRHLPFSPRPRPCALCRLPRSACRCVFCRFPVSLVIKFSSSFCVTSITHTTTTTNNTASTFSPAHLHTATPSPAARLFSRRCGPLGTLYR